jgi:hypothetical protein
MDTLSHVARAVWGECDAETTEGCTKPHSADAPIDMLFRKRKTVLHGLRGCAAEARVLDDEDAAVERAYTLQRSELAENRVGNEALRAEYERSLALIDDEAAALQDDFISGVVSTPL